MPPITRPTAAPALPPPFSLVLPLFCSAAVQLLALPFCALFLLCFFVHLLRLDLMLLDLPGPCISTPF